MKMEMKGRMENEKSIFYNEKVEKTFLTHIIANPDKYVNSTISKDDFYIDDYRHIYAAYEEAARKNFELGKLSIGKFLDKDRESSLEKLDVSRATLSVNDFDTLKKELKDLSKKRGLEITLKESLAALQNSTSSEVSNNLINKAVARNDTDMNIINFQDALSKGLEVVSSRMKGEIVGVRSRWPKLNRKLGGSFQKGMQYIIGARPRTGKTAIANLLISDFTDEALNPSADVLILYWNFEMPSWKQTLRLLSSESKMTVNEMLSAETPLSADTYSRLQNLGSSIKHKPIFFVDVPANYREIREECLRFSMNFPDSHIVNVMDHTLLAAKDKDSETNRDLVSDISKTFMYLKKKIDCTNIILSQVKRDADGPERREEYFIPRISDLVWSSELEQDADVILFLHNLSEFNLETFEKYKVEDDMYVLSISKNRDGESGIILLRQDLAHNNFAEYEGASMINEDGTINLKM
jgi:replicative DNA helicase